MRDIMKARAYVFRYLRKFLDSKGFYEITPPLLTKAGGETGADLFDVDYCRIAYEPLLQLHVHVIVIVSHLRLKMPVLCQMLYCP